MELQKCKWCGAYPVVKKIDDLYYAQCSKCAKLPPYQFVGRMEKFAIDQWNCYNVKYAAFIEHKEGNLVGKYCHTKYRYNVRGQEYTASHAAKLFGLVPGDFIRKFNQRKSNEIFIQGCLVGRRAINE